MNILKYFYNLDFRPEKNGSCYPITSPRPSCNAKGNGIQEITRLCDGRCCLFNGTNYDAGETVIVSRKCNYTCSKL